MVKRGFIAGLAAGCGLFVSVLALYERWAWRVAAHALTWGR
jgi:hypothetical protein